MASKRKIIDWESVERDYRAGLLSIRKIAVQYDVTEGAIRARAKKNEWQRDLSDKVKQAARGKLLRSNLRTDAMGNEVRITDEEIIDKASNDAVALIQMHCRSSAKYRQLADRVSEHLMDTEINEENCHTYSRSLNSGVDALGKAIKLERQAFNLDDHQEKQQTSDLAELMDSMEYPNIAVS